MNYLKLIVFSLVIFLVSCKPADLARIKNVNLKNKGIELRYNNVAKGLYKKPFIIDFGNVLKKMSDGKVDVQAINSFTVGDNERSSKYTNMLDPLSKFKDSWFGVYFIIDDEEKKGRKFMLKDPKGDPASLENISDDAMLMIPSLDQKLIVYYTHQNQKNYKWKDFDKEFYFDVFEKKYEKIKDKENREWKKLTGFSNTIAALTDIEKTKMRIISSIRVYVGLPNAEIYNFVDPWHKITIKGCVLSRYFSCSKIKFWAILYYNGSAFKNNKGEMIDNWENTDIKSVFEKMIDEITIGCAK